MKIAGIVIDAWKLDIFKKHLDKAKRVYTQSIGPDTAILKVEYEWVSDLKPIIDAANRECEKFRNER